MTVTMKGAVEAKAVAVPAWMRKGNKAAEHIAQIDKEVSEKQEKYKNRLYRFWLTDGEEARVTFVDGTLTEKGVLDITTYMEHNLFENGTWGHEYVCTMDVEPCPICQEGNKPSLVGALTIIDHRKIEGKSGKVYQDERRLYIAKRDTIKTLQSLAGKRGGLAGCVFDILRTGEKSSRVGSHFDFQEKVGIEDLKKKYTREIDGKMQTYFVPSNYATDIEFISAETLRAKGYGSKVVGAEKSLQSKSSLKDQL